MLVVTGAQGFVGSHLVRFFSSKNSGGVLGFVRKHKETDVSLNSNFSLEACDLTKDLPDRPDYRGCPIVHTAGMIKGDFEDYWRTNVLGTKNVLDWAVRHNSCGFIFFSTGGVYGYTDGEFVSEDAQIDPIGVYGHTKWIGEQLCRMYAMEYRLPVTILRLYFPYGPGQQSGIFAFIDRAVSDGLEVTVQKDGAPHFRPTHLEDIATAVEAVIQSLKTQAGFNMYRVYNLCGDDQVSFRKLLSMYEEKHGKKAVFSQMSEKDGDLLGDNSKLKLSTGWRPVHTVRGFLS